VIVVGSADRVTVGARATATEAIFRVEETIAEDVVATFVVTAFVVTEGFTVTVAVLVPPGPEQVRV
jgi:hypothetical protein